MRVVFWGTPEFACDVLGALIGDGHEVAAVVCQPDRPRGRGRKLAEPPTKQTACALRLRILQPDDPNRPELVTELAPGLPQVLGDPTQLRQVLVNLVVNALQAMSGGGRLEVRTESGKDQVWLMVQDTGTGMSEKVKKQIFTPFFTTKDVGEGTGLGLAVVYGIVKSHKGSIQFDSEVGRGTRFRIQLPAANPRETRKGR